MRVKNQEAKGTETEDSYLWEGSLKKDDQLINCFLKMRVLKNIKRSVQKTYSIFPNSATFKL